MPTKQLKKTNKNSCPKAYLQWATAFVLCLSLFSCNGFIYDETQPIEAEAWTEDNNVTFSFTIDDTTKHYNIFLEVDHSVNYGYQNVYCNVVSLVDDRLIQKQQVSLELADKKGKWKGECSGENCTRTIPFIVNTQFDQAGDYKIVLTQYTRQANLTGINSLRLMIEETELKAKNTDSII